MICTSLSLDFFMQKTSVEWILYFWVESKFEGTPPQPNDQRAILELISTAPQ